MGLFVARNRTRGTRYRQNVRPVVACVTDRVRPVITTVKQHRSGEVQALVGRIEGRGLGFSHELRVLYPVVLEFTRGTTVTEDRKRASSTGADCVFLTHDCWSVTALCAPSPIPSSTLLYRVSSASSSFYRLLLHLLCLLFLLLFLRRTPTLVASHLSLSRILYP